MQLSTLIPDVLIEIPTLLDAVALSRLRLAAIDLCTESLCWRKDLTVTLSGAQTYTLPIPVGAELVEPTSVSVAETGPPLRPQTVPQMNLRDPLWRTRVGVPYYYLLPSQSVILFAPNPSTGTANVQVALRPTSDGTEIDDRAGSTFSEELTWGALARLFRMPGRDWFNVRMSEHYQRKFDDGIDRAKNQGANSFAKVGRKVRYGGY